MHVVDMAIIRCLSAELIAICAGRSCGQSAIGRTTMLFGTSVTLCYSGLLFLGSFLRTK